VKPFRFWSILIKVKFGKGSFSHTKRAALPLVVLLLQAMANQAKRWPNKANSCATNLSHISET